MFLKTLADMAFDSKNSPSADRQLYQALHALNKAFWKQQDRHKEPLETRYSDTSAHVEDTYANFHAVLWDELAKQRWALRGDWPPEQGSDGEDIMSKLNYLMVQTDTEFGFRYALNDDRRKQDRNDLTLLFLITRIKDIREVAAKLDILAPEDIKPHQMMIRVRHDTHDGPGF